MQYKWLLYPLSIYTWKSKNTESNHDNARIKALGLLVFSGEMETTARLFLLTVLVMAIRSTVCQKPAFERKVMQARNVTFSVKGRFSGRRDRGHVAAALNISVLTTQFNALVHALDAAQDRVIEAIDFLNISTRSYNYTFRARAEELDSLRASLGLACQLVKCSKPLDESKYHAPSPHTMPEIDYESIEDKFVPAESFAEYDTNNISSSDYADYGKNVSLDEAIDDKSSKREKRQIAEIMSMAAMGLSIYTQAELDTLKVQVFDNSDRISDLTSVVIDQQSVIQSNTDHIEEVQYRLQEIHTTVQRIAFIQQMQAIEDCIHLVTGNLKEWANGLIAALIRNEITPRLFDYKTLMASLRVLGNRAARHNLRPVGDTLSFLVTQPVSYVVRKEIVYLFIHVPLVQTTTLTLYEYVNEPFYINTTFVATVKLRKPVLATNDDLSRFVELDYDQLALCERSSDVYMCPYGLVRKHLEKSCVGSLFFGDTQGVAKHCEVQELVLHHEYVVQTGLDKVTIYAPPGEKVPAYVTCAEKPALQQQYAITQRMTIAVPVGCTLSTKAYSFQPVTTIHIDAVYVIKPMLNYDVGEISSAVTYTTRLRFAQLKRLKSAVLKTPQNFFQGSKWRYLGVAMVVSSSICFICFIAISASTRSVGCSRGVAWQAAWRKISDLLSKQKPEAENETELDEIRYRYPRIRREEGSETETEKLEQHKGDDLSLYSRASWDSMYSRRPRSLVW